MLITNTAHEFLSIAGDVDTKSWRSVGLELRIPYIFITFRTEVDRGVWLSQTSILWRDTDLVSVCHEIQESSTNKISQIIPGSDSDAERWNLAHVAEVWHGRVLTLGCDAVAYILLDGMLYVHGNVIKSKNFVRQRRAYRQA